MTQTMEQPSNGLAMREQAPAKREGWSAGIGQRGIVLNNFSDLWKMAQAIAASGLAPKNMQRVEALFVALEMGLEVGLAPMAAIRSIAVINGRPAIYGDAALALVRASGYLESFEERIEGSGDARRAICISKRKGMPVPRITTFSVADATKAGMWGKEGPWRQYPERMLQFRARGFNLRDEFGDVLNGMVTAEEAQDIPREDAVPVASPEPQRGVAGLVKRITSRPVSEGQTFEPEPEAVAQAEAEQSAAAAETTLEDVATDPDTAGAEAEPPSEPAPSPQEQFWIHVREAAEAVGLTDEKFVRNGVKKWALKLGIVGREHEAKSEDVTALLSAIGSRSGHFAG